ncbi:MAG: hypothetical protein WA130_07865 [Candidatus Methanoperedens sp.]
MAGLLIELIIISSFLILRGYLLFTETREENIISITNVLFKVFFLYFVALCIASIFSLFFIIISIPALTESPYYYYFSIIYFVISLITIIIIILYLINFKKADLKESLNIIRENADKSGWYWPKRIVAYIIILTLLFISLIAPTYLLGGSYSIDVFPQSEVNSNILTFTIKETGLTSGRNFINLYKSDDDHVFQDIDNITIISTQEISSKNKLMTGTKHEGIWYLNLNTSNLSYGNYMLHAEVSYINLNNLEIFKKHADKLFYIAPRSTNYSIQSSINS